MIHCMVGVQINHKCQPSIHSEQQMLGQSVLLKKIVSGDSTIAFQELKGLHQSEQKWLEVRKWSLGNL